MHRIDTGTRAVDLFGAGKDGFKDGDKALGIAPTDLAASWFNDVQENLCRLIEAAGIALSAGDYAQLSDAIIVKGMQRSAFNVAPAAGTADAITAVFTPAIAELTDGMLLMVRAAAANTSTTPTFTPHAGTIAAKTIVKGANSALSPGDIEGAGHWIGLQFDAALDKWVLQNPLASVLSLFTGSNQLLATNGYQKLPGGLILQWGLGTLPNSGSTSSTQSITWPVNFPTACVHAGATPVGNVNSSSGYIPKMQSSPVSTTGATFTGESGNGSVVFNQTCPYRWISIGY